MEIDSSLNEKKIQRILNGFMSSPKYVVDGLFVFKWESDKLIWTKAGYIYEFEIKISRADYQNDFKHKAEKHLLLNSKMKKPSEMVERDLFTNLFKQKQKHYPKITLDQTKQMYGYPEDTPTPNYFYYAVPDGLIEPDEVPPYAGLIYITTYKGTFENEPNKWHHDIKLVRKAPPLHNAKYTDTELNLSEKFYYNMHTAINKAEKCVKDRDRMKAQLDEELAAHGKDMTYSQLESQYKDAVSSRDLYQKMLDNYKGMYFTMVEGADLNSIERHLFIKEIKKYNPDFDYQTIIDEADRIYKVHYPDRK